MQRRGPQAVHIERRCVGIGRVEANDVFHAIDQRAGGHVIGQGIGCGGATRSLRDLLIHKPLDGALVRSQRRSGDAARGSAARGLARRQERDGACRTGAHAHDAAIAEARTAVGLNLSNAFVISMLGCVLGFGGYPDEALERIRQAMRASPQDPLTWLWTLWSASIQLGARRFESALEALHQVLRLRPGLAPAYELMAACLGRGTRRPEADPRAVLRASAAPSTTAAVGKAGTLRHPRGRVTIGGYRT